MVRKTLLLILLVLSPVMIYVVRLPERKVETLTTIPDELAFADETQTTNKPSYLETTRTISKNLSNIPSQTSATTTSLLGPTQSQKNSLPTQPTSKRPETITTVTDLPTTITPSKPKPVSTTTSQTTDSTFHSTQTSTIETEERTLIFSEEFDFFDSSIWEKEDGIYSASADETQCFVPEQVSVNDGKLILQAEPLSLQCAENKPRKVASGMVRSKNIAFSPGQSIEYRVKFTPSSNTNQGGLRPSFTSFLPSQGAWTGFEVNTSRSPKRSTHSIFFNDDTGIYVEKIKELWADENFSAQWHIMRFDYGRNGLLTWYVDGEIVHQIAYQKTLEGWPAPFDQPMTEFVIRLAVGDLPQNEKEDKSSQSRYEIDYIRIYEP